ncbi:hypothetical protein [Streptomyces sp. NPDC048248]|uniref:hypothetical protein n=1 Tax=Streptomyces sp. NPDC048248 TaxID=3365523 RepID=UPI00371A18A5
MGEQLSSGPSRSCTGPAMCVMRRINEQIHGDVSPAGPLRGAKVAVGPLRERYWVG